METIEQLKAELRKAKAEATYYRTMWDLEHVNREELEEHNKVLRGQVRDLMMDRTYQVA